MSNAVVILQPSLGQTRGIQDAVDLYWYPWSEDEHTNMKTIRSERIATPETYGRQTMALPPRAYYSVTELTYRWECSLHDLLGWAAVEKFDIMTMLAPIRVGRERVSGFVVVSVPDIFPLVRPSARAPEEVRLERVRVPSATDWLDLDDLARSRAVMVRLDDLFVLTQDVQNFEVAHSLLRRPASHIGASARYDWENMYVSQILRIYERGVPASQAAWIEEVQEWFAEKSDDGNIPDERTIRRRLTPIWSALRSPD
jgi:hypothetical protein